MRVQTTENITTRYGQAVVGATVGVLIHGTQAPATLWAAETGQQTLPPLVTDANGVFSCWLDEGRYDIVVSGALQKTIEVINEGDAGQAAIAAETTRAQAVEVPAWAPNTVYALGQQTSFGAQIYGASTAHTSGSTRLAANWTLLVPGVTDSSAPAGKASFDYGVIRAAPLNPMWAEYAGGVKFDGATDDTAAWTALFAALNARGVEIYIPPAGTSIISQLVVPINSVDITIRGGGSQNGNNGSCRLLSSYAGAGPVLAAQAATGLRLSGFQIQNNAAAFTGELVDLSRAAGTQDTAQFELRDMRLQAVAQAGSSARLLQLTKATVGLLEGVYGYGGAYAVEGRAAVGDYCNTVTVGDKCYFNGQDLAALHNLGNACRVKGVTFEPLRSGAAGAYLQDPTLPGQGLLWLGNWTGDSTITGSWIIYNGDVLTVLGGSLDTAVDGIKLNGPTNGLLVDGVRFNNLTNGVNLNAQALTGFEFGAANRLITVTNPIIGSAPIVRGAADGMLIADSGANPIGYEVANGNQRLYARVNADGTPVLGNSGGGDVVKIGDPNASWSTLGLLGTLRNENATNEVIAATAGTNGAAPTQVKGYLIAQDHLGATIKIPYYAA